MFAVGAQNSGPGIGIFLIAVLLIWPAGHAGATDQEVRELRREVKELRSRISEMEDLKGRLNELEERLKENGEYKIAEKESVSESSPDSEDSERMDIGGALRFNTFWKSYDGDIKTRRGDIGLDLFRLNVDGRKSNILISAEYRWYPYMDTIHHGWIGYDFGDLGRIQAGITRVPFGLLPYAAHNYWFGIPYYLGLADDYDAGLKYVYDHSPWNLQLAFFKNGELADAENLERYSYDLVAVDQDRGRNEEDNQVNARLAYTLNEGVHLGTELGLSLQYGQVYNRDSDDNGDHWAAALHLDGRYGRWNYQLELGRYGYDPRNPAGVSDSTVTIGAFTGSYPVASQGNFGAANIAYNLPPPWRVIDSLTVYNDFSFLFKDKDDFEESYLNTIGCAVGIGPVFSYIDLILGRNYFGDGSLAGGGSRDWEARFNFNIGYYF